MPHVVCIGGACIDRKYHILASLAQPGTSNPARAERGFGGVARNVAENLARLGADTALLCAVGDDENGQALLEHARRCGIDTGLSLRASNYVTSEYGAVVDSRGDLVIGVSDMSAVDALRAADLEPHWAQISRSSYVFLDCNLPSAVLAWCAQRARSSGTELIVDAVSESKVRRLPQDLSGIALLVLNDREAASYLGEDERTFRARTPLERAQSVRERGAGAVILTRGARGAVVARQDGCVEIAALRVRAVDVTGAGDALVAATMFRLLEGDDLARAARIGVLCAGLTVESPASVRPDLSAELLRAHHHRIEACTAT